MAKNYLLIYSEHLATEIELLCQNLKAPSNTLFQIRKSSSSVYANIREANYGQSKSDMISKFEISLKECTETEGWLKLLFETNIIDEEMFRRNRNLCGRIRRMLISSCKTLKDNKWKLFILLSKVKITPLISLFHALIIIRFFNQFFYRSWKRYYEIWLWFWCRVYVWHW